PVVRVVTGGSDIQEEAWEGEGTMVNSPPLDGLSSAAAKTAAIAWLEARGAGQAQVQYRLRDWLFSRQRYWGEPLPILHRADGSGVAPPDDALPLLPPELEDYKPTATGEPPLARARNGCARPIRRPAPQLCARPTPCRNGRDPAGTICASSIRTTTGRSLIARRNVIGCQSISMSAARSMPCSTCCMRASGTSCSTTSAS